MPSKSRIGACILCVRYETFEQLQDALRTAGLESSNLVIGIDYTKVGGVLPAACL